MMGLLVFIFSLSGIFSQTIDPELERYFEKRYGYLKDDPLRDSPSSITQTSTSFLKDKIFTYTLIPQPDYTEIPLHYDLKKQNTSGPLSYYITLPSKNTILKTYTMVDVTVDKDEYLDVIKKLSSIGFLMAGEETSRESKNTVIFGWVCDSYFNSLFKIKGVERVSISSRKLSAPPISLLITVKVPNNRSLTVFIDRFITKLSEYGFRRENLEILSEDKKYRFSVIRIKGSIPLDKIKLIIRSPFVVEVQS
ncbi:MAG: hypothetical protein ACP5PA_02185 [Elusimicrobiales bacterium]